MPLLFLVGPMSLLHLTVRVNLMIFRLTRRLRVVAGHFVKHWPHDERDWGFEVHNTGLTLGNAEVGLKIEFNYSQ